MVLTWHDTTESYPACDLRADGRFVCSLIEYTKNQWTVRYSGERRKKNRVFSGTLDEVCIQTLRLYSGRLAHRRTEIDRKISRLEGQRRYMGAGPELLDVDTKLARLHGYQKTNAARQAATKTLLECHYATILHD